jgi:aryl-alcohol dehydrogenase-like predicted oxidoreductase
MEYRQFGQTDLQVSAIGFGCWEIGGTYGKIETMQFQQAVQRAIDAGINCFDTAEAYGMGASELCSAADWRHGLRFAGLWHAHRHLSR